MRLFRKSRKAEDDWALSQGTWAGKPIIVRFNKAVGKRRDVQRNLRHQVKIVVPIHDPNESGFPTGNEADQLQAIENHLFANVEAEGHTMLVGALTSDGMREFAMYTDSPDEVREKLVAVSTEIRTHQLEFQIREDPDWLVFKEITS